MNSRVVDGYFSDKNFLRALMLELKIGELEVQAQRPPEPKGVSRANKSSTTFAITSNLFNVEE
jgi:hypothetical protein